MKKVLLVLGSLFLLLPLSSFKPVEFKTKAHSAAIKSNSKTFDAGYFSVGSQEYHCYVDHQFGTVIGLYKTVALGPDGASVTVTSGFDYETAPPAQIYSVNVHFNDGGPKSYNGPVIY